MESASTKDKVRRIIVYIILIIMATPVGQAIETALKSMVQSFLDQVTAATANIKPF